MDFARQSRTFMIVLVALLGTGSLLRAQQSADAPAPAPNNPAPAAIATPPTVTQTAGAAAASDPNAKVTNDSSLPSASPAEEGAPFLKLQPGDLLEIGVYNVPELSTKARVGNSGDVYLPLVDYVHVGDLTVEEAQVLLEKRLEDGGFVRSPHVTIFVDEATSQGVTVLGEVSKPGIYPVLGERKLYDIVSEAGGFLPTAGRKVNIIRHNQPQPIALTLPRNLGDNFDNNVGIFPGDTITVSRAPIIYVVGDVGRPSGLLVDSGHLTVLQAIALAGGTNRTAKMGGVRIVRKTPTGMTETTVPLKKMLEAKATDVDLQADDILFVPVSAGKVLAARTAEAAMSAATAVSIYAVHP
jgi:polysaccharide export outer membrane protein